MSPSSTRASRRPRYTETVQYKVINSKMQTNVTKLNKSIKEALVHKDSTRCKVVNSKMQTYVMTPSSARASRRPRYTKKIRVHEWPGRKQQTYVTKLNKSIKETYG